MRSLSSGSHSLRQSCLWVALLLEASRWSCPGLPVSPQSHTHRHIFTPPASLFPGHSETTVPVCGLRLPRQRSADQTGHLCSETMASAAWANHTSEPDTDWGRARQRWQPVGHDDVICPLQERVFTSRPRESTARCVARLDTQALARAGWGLAVCRSAAPASDANTDNVLQGLGEIPDAAFLMFKSEMATTPPRGSMQK